MTDNDDRIKLEASWKEALREEFDKPYMKQLGEFLRQEKAAGKVIFPPGPLIFNALNTTPLENVKVVIIGQDPYHGPGQAHGLCFSVQPGVPTPPSLQNIYKELNRDLNIPIPNNGYLQRWAEQGVLLLNTSLTVEQAEGRLPRQCRLAAVHRPRHRGGQRALRAPGVPALGQPRAEQAEADRPAAPPDSQVGAPVAVVGLPRFPRQRPLQPHQQVPRAERQDAYRLVAAGPLKAAVAQLFTWWAPLCASDRARERSPHEAGWKTPHIQCLPAWLDQPARFLQ